MKMAELRSEVIYRDGACVASLLDRSHECRDRWGRPHRPDELDSLTLGHVREEPGGMRRDEPGWCIAQCWASNAEHWESANAVAARSYLVAVRNLAHA